MQKLIPQNTITFPALVLFERTYLKDRFYFVSAKVNSARIRKSKFRKISSGHRIHNS